MDTHPRPRHGFASMDRNKILEMALPSPEQAAREAERHRMQALEAIRVGDYNTAAALYHILVAQGWVRHDDALIIEGKLRLAGVTHLMGDDKGATEFIAQALVHKETSGSDFDVPRLLDQAIRDFHPL